MRFSFIPRPTPSTSPCPTLLRLFLYALLRQTTTRTRLLLRLAAVAAAVAAGAAGAAAVEETLLAPHPEVATPLRDPAPTRLRADRLRRAPARDRALLPARPPRGPRMMTPCSPSPSRTTMTTTACGSNFGRSNFGPSKRCRDFVERPVLAELRQVFHPRRITKECIYLRAVLCFTQGIFCLHHDMA